VEQKTLANVVAATTSSNAGAVDLDSLQGVFYLDVTAASGTTPTLDVDIEEQDLVSGKWFVVASFTQAGAVTQERILSPSPANNGAPYPGGLPGRKYRAAYAIGGTTPSFTFKVGFAGSGN
jgi:hypothetical protein